MPGRSSREDKNEAAMDRAKGRMKEAGGALTGDKGKKREAARTRGRPKLRRRRPTSRIYSRNRGPCVKGLGY